MIGTEVVLRGGDLLIAKKPDVMGVIEGRQKSKRGV
jgi:hypothetical protein